MTMKLLIAGAGLVALAAAAPSTAQYYPPYAGNYGAPYGNAYGHYTSDAERFAADRCAAEVQSRLSRNVGVSGILGTMFGQRTTAARVVGVTRVKSTNAQMRVTGLASSGRYAYNDDYGPYGYGAYGAVGYNTAQQADLVFKCNVDYRGRVSQVDIRRR